ncbi:MAG TPA: isoaspartyl peptidase/L-asparaginase family protein [Candidatus Polarisedimenticolaceae bacterium]|nr:isoaspartyl peptidase/L-asparaginase family protein [Candidatus Polarisedimenticolaceae bacterium]
MPLALAIHGGAWNIPDEDLLAYRTGVRAALEQGWDVLRGGASALDVVERVVRLLEDDPTFDAGRGSRVNREGRVELDASIMDGSALHAGAVAAIQGVRHPISVARCVMTRSQHVMLAGEGARRFAIEVGAELCRTEELLVGRELERYRRVQAGESQLVDDEFGAGRGPEGTVGAVALDAAGHLAAGTSTGGTQNKLAGRVGDTPVIGAGTYADDGAGAASATGWGEGILRVVLAKSAIDLMAAGHHPAEAGGRALETLQRVQGRAGLILLDPLGRSAAVFNTPRMARGWVGADGALHVEVERVP